MNDYYKLSEPLKSNKFEITLSSKILSTILNTDDFFPLTAIKLSMPLKKTEVITIPGRNNSNSYAGRTLWESKEFKTTHLETENLNMLRAISIWQALMFESKLGIGLQGTETSGVMTVKYLKANNSVSLTRQITGVFPTSIRGYNFDATSSALINTEVSWSFDDII
jgi:hypothetical protein